MNETLAVSLDLAGIQHCLDGLIHEALFGSFLSEVPNPILEVLLGCSICSVCGKSARF